VWVVWCAFLLGCGLGFVLCLGWFWGFVGVWERVWSSLLCMGACWLVVVVGVGYVGFFGLFHFSLSCDYPVWTVMLSIMNPEASVGRGRSMTTMLKGCPARFSDSVPSG